MKAQIRNRRAAALTALALLAASPATAEPLFQVEGRRLFLPAPPGTPTSLYEMRYPVGATLPSDADITRDLEIHTFPEQLVIKSINGNARTISFITTHRGVNALLQSGRDVRQLEADKPDPTCVKVFATVQLNGAPPKADDKIIARTVPTCPFAEEIYPHRQLVVEGLDISGKRLFATVSVDPRWSIHESIGADGKLALGSIGRKPAVSTYVDFRAPIDVRLKTLRVWQISETTQEAKVIGTIAWTSVSIAP